MAIDHTRHSGIFNASSVSVTLIGAGGIGAITGITLAKMGVPYIHIYDDDRVDEVNIATQFHKVSDIGTPKVEALTKAMVEYAGIEPQTSELRVDKDTVFETQFVISAVDSITARKGIWEAVKSSKPRVYLDARMGAEQFQLYTIPMAVPDKVAMYDELMQRSSDDLIPDAPCTSKATIFTANIAAGFLGRAVRLLITRKPVEYLLSLNILEGILQRIG